MSPSPPFETYDEMVDELFARLVQQDLAVVENDMIRLTTKGRAAVNPEGRKLHGRADLVGRLDSLARAVGINPFEDVRP